MTTKTAIERAYEALFIVRPELGEKDLAKLEKQLGETLSRLEGQVGEITNLGKRRLSTRVKKLSEAITLQIRFKAPPSAVAPFIKAAQLLEPVARILVVREDLGSLSKQKVSSASEREGQEGFHGESQ